VRATGQRSQWPLISRVAAEQFRSGFLLVGNAAHTLHPVAGQGLNLSLREAALLAKVLASCWDDATPIGQPGFLSRYLDEVTREQHFVTQSTDMLATLFNRRGFVMDGPRNVSLVLLDFMPSMRARVASIGTGRRYA
jgi:2-polyprenyl-6-methoxyphenol hydroxylase-like FAD-dependent oxidoreductase